MINIRDRAIDGGNLNNFVSTRISQHRSHRRGESEINLIAHNNVIRMEKERGDNK